MAVLDLQNFLRTFCCIFEIASKILALSFNVHEKTRLPFLNAQIELYKER